MTTPEKEGSLSPQRASSISATPRTVSRRFGRASEAEDRLLVELGKKYRILAQLGEGGTARVWLAMARGPSGFNKMVVLKTMRGEHFDDESVVEMFLDEARLAARLSHPHIVQTNEVFEQSYHPVIVMEYLDGLPFSVILERQREGSALALAMLLRIISDALSGLHAAHELTDYDGTPLPVVHRDVSPHNLFVTFAGEVKVLDFGIARLSTSSETTESGVIKGKLRYIAPEQIDSEGPVDRRADIYSMGVILWEVATAQRMWAGVPEPVIVKRIVAGDLPQVRAVNPDVDEDLAAIIDRALSTHRSQRYATALEFQSDLDRYVATLGGALRNRDIGRALTKMFEDVRTERRETIEAQLLRSDSLHDIQISRGPVPELTSFSNVRAPHSMAQYDLRPGPRTLIVLALAAMCAFVFALFWPDHTPTPRERYAPAMTAPQRRPPATRPSVSFRVTAFPREARLHLDGKPLDSNPYVAKFPRDKETVHHLMAESAGYEPALHSVVFKADQEVVLTLSKVVAQPKPAPAPPPRPRAPAPVPQPEATSAAPKPDCSMPFYFDSRGIKKYRAECL